MAKHRQVAFVLNPAPEGARYMQMARAESLVRRRMAEWEPGTDRIYIYRKGEAEMIQLELRARFRRDGEAYTNRMIQESRFSAVSWSGSTRKHLPPFERDRMAPVTPGQARS